jgi:hypothetical protein
MELVPIPTLAKGFTLREDNFLFIKPECPE